MTRHQQHDHPAPGPSEDGPGAGVPGGAGDHGSGDGPPDWFAAVAGEEEEPAQGSDGPPDWFAAAAGEPAAPVGELPGLVRASELPGGRRRRRSALGELPAAEPVAAERPRARRRTKAERGESGRGESERAETGGTEGGRTGGDGESRSGRRGRARAVEPVGDPADRARDICLRLLTGAAKSRKQLADALRRKEIPDEVAEQVLSRLEEVGLIDDAAFAEAWVESRHAVRGLSRRALAQELRTKGVAGEAAERALLQVDAEDESEAARALVARKLRSTAGLERDVRIRRLVGVLARRGYAEGLAFRVVREALDAEGADGAEEGAEDWADADD
ncbi:regulatory protein [Kitasatospora sp. SolWspMP-SS2h]|uniref:regulatory protein RecX n=1 Tax=Kitasatospora sp. SolWspMP-SS2h TaxID=1305729 RepID=UPI000DBFAC5B|nr:regulatory protein RecX [Kitasatospora sp. SolWspMP-SS2h]RAJ35936.1 regulatory protein [Kitasatospora sp. SolWspMP-SS2h]